MSVEYSEHWQLEKLSPRKCCHHTAAPARTSYRRLNASLAFAFSDPLLNIGELTSVEGQAQDGIQPISVSGAPVRFLKRFLLVCSSTVEGAVGTYRIRLLSWAGPQTHYFPEILLDLAYAKLRPLAASLWAVSCLPNERDEGQRIIFCNESGIPVVRFSCPTSTLLLVISLSMRRHAYHYGAPLAEKFIHENCLTLFKHV
jgi:hypothetical protein